MSAADPSRRELALPPKPPPRQAPRAQLRRDAGHHSPGEHRKLVGERGEARAAEWYARRGYRILARNWRCLQGEIDLILQKDRTYVFCEVKARSSTAFGGPAEAVTRSKQARIRRSAARWLAEQPARPLARVRFDVVAILAGELEVLEDAF